MPVFFHSNDKTARLFILKFFKTIKYFQYKLILPNKMAQKPQNNKDLALNCYSFLYCNQKYKITACPFSETACLFAEILKRRVAKDRQTGG